MKEETLEEAAENAYKKHSVKDDVLSLDEQIQRSGGFIVGFKEGANWQAERRYSEEEVRKIAEEVRWQAIGDPLEFTKNFDKWFEQHKKK